MRLSVSSSRAIVAGLVVAPVLVAGSIVARPALARVARLDGNSYEIVRTYKKGDVDRYKITFHTVISSQQFGNNVDVNLNIVQKETTKDVKDDGSGVFEMEFETAVAKLGDNEMDITQFLPTVTTTRDKNGKTTDVKSEGASGPLAEGGFSPDKMFSTAQGSFYPGHAVKAGDKWDIKSEDVGKDGKKASSTAGTAEVVGTEMIGDTNTLKIHVMTETTIMAKEEGSDKPSEKKMKFDGTGNIDLKSGKTARVVGSIEGEFGPLGKAKADLKIALVDPNAKPDAAAAK